MEEDRGRVVRPRLHLITKHLTKRTIVIKRQQRSWIFGHVFERKRASDAWVVEKILEDIARLGYQNVILNGDGEPTSAQVLGHVEHAREAPSITQNSPAYDPQANGEAEKKQFRTT